MYRKLTVFVCLVSFCPAAAGAQELALAVNAQPVQEQPATSEPAKEINLVPPLERLAANDQQMTKSAEEQRPRRTHTGLTFKEFCEIHFGEYRWIYWVGAAAVLVAIHAAH